MERGLDRNRYRIILHTTLGCHIGRGLPALRPILIVKVHQITLNGAISHFLTASPITNTNHWISRSRTCATSRPSCSVICTSVLRACGRWSHADRRWRHDAIARFQNRRGTRDARRAPAPPAGPARRADVLDRAPTAARSSTRWRHSRSIGPGEPRSRRNCRSPAALIVQTPVDRAFIWADHCRSYNAAPRRLVS